MIVVIVESIGANCGGGSGGNCSGDGAGECWWLLDVAVASVMPMAVMGLVKVLVVVVVLVKVLVKVMVLDVAVAMLVISRSTNWSS